MIISKYYICITASNTISRPCEDESWCQEANVDATICEHAPTIYESWFATCSGYSNCKDEEPFCSNINLNPIICKKSPSLRKRCAKTCELCYESPLKGIS